MVKNYLQQSQCQISFHVKTIYEILAENLTSSETRILQISLNSTESKAIGRRLIVVVLSRKGNVCGIQSRDICH